MNITISLKTQQLIEEQMRKGQFSSPDDVLQLALQTLEQTHSEDYEDLDPQARAAIEEAEAQYERGEGRPWEEVRDEVRARFIK